ncbi:MAG: response regulator, partial [Candidatus Omnitrophica bacterium]|nr:response regulator [Candidatus Omnitrophota bacterium]
KGEKSMAKILIVDDESGIRQVLNKFFKIKGLQTLEAENGEQALQIASSENCSVALLDMGMPGMDGLVLLEKLLKINPRLTVMLMSGRNDDEKIKKALELGAAGFIMKPFDFSELESTVISKLKNE